MFKFHDNLTVNESRILPLLRQIWVYAGKRELRERNISLTKDILSQSQCWGCAKMSSESSVQISQ